MDFISFDNKVKYVNELEKVVLTNHSDTLIELIEILKRYDITLSKSQTNTSFEAVEQPDLLSVDEVSELLGVSKPAVYKWIRTGKIEYVEPPVENGKGYLIPRKQFEERLSNRLTKKSAMTPEKIYEIQRKHFGEIELLSPNDVFHNGIEGEEEK
jgi:excisionase family DNA binding protein